MGSEFSGSHRRLRTPSDTFTNFHRCIHMSNQEYLVFHSREYLSPLTIPNTRIFHFLFLLCNHETCFGHCPILPSPPSNTKHSVDLPCTHDIPSNTKHNVDLYHALTLILCNVPCINAMQFHCMYLMLHAQGMSCATIQDHTSCQVSWIIILIHIFYLHSIQYSYHTYFNMLPYNQHVIHSSCTTSIHHTKHQSYTQE